MPRFVTLRRTDSGELWRVALEKVEGWGAGPHEDSPGFVEYAGRQIPVQQTPEELDRLLGDADEMGPIAAAARGLSRG